MASDDMWWLGAILVLIGTIGQNLGNNIVSVAHANRHKEEEAEREEREASESSARKSVLRNSMKSLEEGQSGSQAVDIGALEGDGIDQKLIRDDAEGSDNDAEEERKNDSCWNRNLWAIGSTIFVLGSLTNFVSFGYAAQSLLASLQSVQFVSNMVFAKIVHKEHISRIMYMATGFIVAGNILVVIFFGTCRRKILWRGSIQPVGN